MISRRLMAVIGLFMVAIIASMAVLAGCGTTPTPTTAPSPAPAPSPTATTAPSPAPAPKPSPAPAPAQAPGKTYSWRLATLVNPGDIRLAYLEEWVKNVESASAGRIKIKIFPSDTLVSSRDTAKALSSGIIELSAMITPGYFAGIIPAINTWAVFTPKDTRKFHQDPEIFDILNKELEKQMNSHFVYINSVVGVEWFFREQITSPEQLKGKLIRSLGGAFDATLDAWGAKNVYMPSAEIYTAAQRGTVDGAGTSVESWHKTKLSEVFPYVLRAGLWERLRLITAMNLDLWNELPKDLQDIVTKTGRDVDNTYWDIMPKEYDKILDDLSKAGKIKVTNLSPELRAEWLKRVLPLFEKYFKESGPFGEQMFKIIQAKH